MFININITSIIVVSLHECRLFHVVLLDGDDDVFHIMFMCNGAKKLWSVTFRKFLRKVLSAKLTFRKKSGHAHLTVVERGRIHLLIFTRRPALLFSTFRDLPGRCSTGRVKASKEAM